MRSTVDVIIPTYNGLPYLNDAIESVLAQTHSDLVLYVIDDGSTDRSATKKYVQSLKDKRVHYVHKQNGGQATARNHGIKVSNSPFITFLDSDDIWHPDKLEKQLAVFDKNPRVGMVYGLCKLIDDNNNVISEVTFQKRGNLFRYLLHNNRISGSGSMVMVKREVFGSIGVFHEDFLIGEDWEMWLRIAKNYEIDYVPEFLASLRVLDTGMQRNYIKMAKGLEYMLPSMVREFKLGALDRARLGKTCLKEACFLYFNGGDRPAARRMFLRSFLYNPLTFFTLNYHVWFVYMRILLGNEWLRVIRRRVSPSYRSRELDAIVANDFNLPKPPLVSVVMSVYNGEKYLAKAMDSVLNQTFKDFEIIIINDGSTDKTQKIIDSYNDSRVVKIKQKNKGLVASLNIGIGLARGEFIARQDADDISLPNRFEEQLVLLNRTHELVLVGTNVAEINSKDKKIGQRNYPTSDAEIRMSLFTYSPFAHGSVMIRKRAIDEAGDYRQAYYPVEDFDLWGRLAQRGPVANIEKQLYEFRVHDESISSANLDMQNFQSTKLQRELASKPIRIIRTPLNVRRAIQSDSERKQIAVMLLKTSVKHLRLFSSLFMTIAIILATGTKNET
ncbi:MAG TPA: glycosyltransferase [Candidatus Saccharimonadales bacterium]|nr:glycosyltransferase [Candidatus Saccharimonadales bacterium]